MALTNLPEGVSGTETAIAGGPERNTLIIGECADCDFDAIVDAHQWQSGASLITEWDCPICGYLNHTESPWEERT